MAAEPGDSGGVCRWPATTIGLVPLTAIIVHVMRPGRRVDGAARCRRQGSRPRNAHPDERGHVRILLEESEGAAWQRIHDALDAAGDDGTSISTSTHGQGSSRAFARSPAARRSVARGANAVPGATRHRRRRAAPTGGIENWQGGHGVSSPSHSGQSPLPYQRSAHLAVRSRCRFAPTQRKSDGSLTDARRSSQAGVGSMRAQTSASVQSSSPHALAWERASRPKPAMLAVNLVLRAIRVEQDLARSDSRRCRSCSAGFSVQKCSPQAAAAGEKGVRFPAHPTRIVVSPAGDGELPGPGYARAARSVATAARKLAPPAPARDACGPAIVIEMPRRPRRDVARPLGGAPVAQARRGRKLSARRSAPPPRPPTPVARRGWPPRRRPSAARSSGRPGPRRPARGAAWPPRRPGS